MKRVGLLCVLFFCAIGVLFGDEIVFLSNGAGVLLKDDFTWEYISEADEPEAKVLTVPAEAKKVLKSKSKEYSLSYDGAIWDTTKGLNDQAEFQFASKDGAGYAMVIYEAVAFPLDEYSDITFTFYQKADPNAQIVSKEMVSVNGKTGMLRKINATIQGFEFTYLSFLFCNEKGSWQITVYTLASLYPEYEEKFINLVSGLVLKE